MQKPPHCSGCVIGKKGVLHFAGKHRLDACRACRSGGSHQHGTAIKVFQQATYQGYGCLHFTY